MTVIDDHSPQTILAAFNCLDDEGQRHLLNYARAQLDEQRREIGKSCPSWCVSEHDRLTTTCWSDGVEVETADPKVWVELGPVREEGERALVLLFIKGEMESGAYLPPEQARQLIAATEKALQQVEQG